MFGADTPLVMDALQMAAIASIAVGGAVWFFLRKRHKAAEEPKAGGPDNLESRVRVLERIATDRAHDLADEINSLRDRKGVN